MPVPFTLEPSIGKQLSDNGAVFLFDPRLIVLAIRPRPRELNAMRQAVFDEAVVDELISIVDIQRPEGKR